MFRDNMAASRKLNSYCVFSVVKHLMNFNRIVMIVMYQITVKSLQMEWGGAGRGACTVLSCSSLLYMYVLYTVNHKKT